MIFCQSGQIRLPSKYPPLVTFLEPCIYDVQAPDADDVFHPKVWALRFIAGDGAIRYRVLCLSRNLTFDRCWDTVVALDGELTDRSNAISPSRAPTIQLRSPSALVGAIVFRSLPISSPLQSCGFSQ